MSAFVQGTITRMSSKGQVVIPDAMRRSLGLQNGEAFAVFAKGDSILLRRLDLPSAEKAFAELSKWGAAHAKKMGIDSSPKAVVRIIRDRRKSQRN